MSRVIEPPTASASLGSSATSGRGLPPERTSPCLAASASSLVGCVDCISEPEFIADDRCVVILECPGVLGVSFVCQEGTCGTGDDVNLYHATFDGKDRSRDERFPSHMSLEGPGLAVFDNKLYCIHRGHGEGHQYLYWSYYNGSIWTADQPTGKPRERCRPGRD